MISLHIMKVVAHPWKWSASQYKRRPSPGNDQLACNESGWLYSQLGVALPLGQLLWHRRYIDKLCRQKGKWKKFTWNTTIMIPINACFHVHACYFHPICIMTWSTCRCLSLDPQRKVRGIKVRRAAEAQWWRRGGMVWHWRPRLLLRDHNRKTATCFTKFPPTQVASNLGLVCCVVLWMILPMPRTTDPWLCQNVNFCYCWI